MRACFERGAEGFPQSDDAFPKVVIAASGLREGVTEDGIQVIPIVPWLLGRRDWR